MKIKIQFKCRRGKENRTQKNKVHATQRTKNQIRVWAVFTVFEGVVLSTAWGQFLHLPAAQPRPFLPELRVELGQDGGVVFDLCKRIISG